MKTLLLSFWLICGWAAQSRAQAPEVIHLEDVLDIIGSDSDTLYVLNFWSTWCKPCVAEMPHFDRLQTEMADQKVKVVFISLDFKSEYRTKLVPFLAKRKLHSRVVFLDEPNFNSWINKVSPEWSGSIPATLFVCDSRDIRKFHEGDFTYEALSSTVNSLMSSHKHENN
jgi:thiol-disulfide isomerase/thioredoxin